MPDDFDPDAFLADTSVPSTKAAPSDFDPDAFLASPTPTVTQAKPPEAPVIPPVDTNATQSVKPVQPSPVKNFLPPIDAESKPVVNQSVGTPAPTDKELGIPVMSQGPTNPGPMEYEHPLKWMGMGEKEIDEAGNRNDATTELEYQRQKNSKDVASIVRSTFGSATQNAAPYALAGIDALTGKTPFDVGLHEWNSLYQQAQEDSPIAANIGTIGGFAALPIGKLGLVGQMGVGAAASGLSTWLGSEMQASAKDVATSAVEGGLVTGALHASMYSMGKGAARLKETYKDRGVNTARELPPILMTPAAVIDFHDSLGAISFLPPESKPTWISKPGPETVLGPLGEARRLQNAEGSNILGKKVMDAESLLNKRTTARLAQVLKTIALDPQSTPTYEVNNLSELHPVGPGAEIDLNPDGTYSVTILEVSNRGVGRYRENIETVGDMERFRKQLADKHPDIAIHATDEAMIELSGDDAMFNASLGRSVKVESKVQTKLPTSPDSTNYQRVPITAELPAGNPLPKPAIASASDGYLSISNLDTIRAKEQSLIGRNVMAINTPKGVRYVRVLLDADNGFQGVAPLAPEEGVPTIARVSRVPVSQLREIPRTELRRVIKEADKLRVRFPNGEHNPPDVHTEGGKYEFPEAQLAAPPAKPPPPPAPPVAPEPVPPPAPPGTPPPPLDAKSWAVVDALKKKLGKGYEAIRRELVPEHLRADFELGNLIADKQSIHNLVAAQTSAQRALERGLKTGKRINEFREDLYKWAKAEISNDENGKLRAYTDEYMAAKYPEQWAAKRDMLKDWERTRDEQHQKIVELGGIDDNTYTDEERGILLKKYVTRTYALQTMAPNKRLKIVEQDVKLMEKATKGYQDWAKANNQTLSEANARGKVIQALATDDPASMLFGEKSGGKPSPNENLKKRLDLPEWYRELLGENRDGIYAISRTDATQKAVIQNLSIWKAISQNPKWCVDSLDKLPIELRDSWAKSQLPINKRWFGAASGKYVAPEVYDSLVTLSNAHYEGNKLAAAVIRIQKANWFSLGRARTYMATLMDNWWYSGLAGGVGLDRPLASGKAMWYVNKAMLEYRKNPFAQNEYAQFIRDGRRMGYDSPGHIGSDLSSQSRRQERYFMEKMAGLPPGSTMPDMLTRMMDVHATITKPGSWMFETADRWHKLATVKMLADDFEGGIDYQGGVPVEVAKKMTREEALRRATRQMMEYFPMYDRASPAAKFMSKGSPGLVAPTAMFAMERNRVNWSIPAQLIRDPKLKFRILKMGAISAGLYGANGAIRSAFGEVTDEDLAAAYQERGMTQKLFQPGLWFLPARIGGQLIPIDLTQSAGPLQYLQGDPELGPVVNVIMTSAMAPIQQGLAGVAVESLLNVGGIKTGFPDKPPLPGQNGWITAGQRVIDRGGIPAMIPEAYNNLNSTGLIGDPTRKQENVPVSMAIARTLGVPVSTAMSVGNDKNPSFQAKISGGVGDIGQNMAFIIMASQLPNDKKVPLLQAFVNELSKDPTPEKQKIIQAAILEIKKAAIDLGTTGRLESAAKASHRPIGGDKDTGTTPRRIGVDTKQ